MRENNLSTTPAGWYPSKKNPGMARYWDGAGWTDQYRPLPDDEEAPPTDYTQAAAPLSHQYQQPAPGYQQQPFQQQNSDWSPANIIETVKTAALDKNNQAIGTQAAGGALIADGIIGFGEKRAGIFGAIGTIIFGIVWIVVTSMMLDPFAASSEIKAGEVKVAAQVSEVKWNESKSSSSKKSSPSCAPIATFNVDGTTYTATSNSYTSPCPWDKGETIDVIYNKDQIAASARVDDSKTMELFTFIFPAAGFLVIAGGVWTFIKRAGSIGAGIYLFRRGKKNREALKGQNTGQ
jgi:hypothetical protein